MNAKEMPDFALPLSSQNTYLSTRTQSKLQPSKMAIF